MLSTRLRTSSASTVGIRTLLTSTTPIAILAIPTQTTVPRATITGTTKTVIRITFVRTTTLAMSPIPTLLAPRLLALLSRADTTLVGSPSPTPRPSATPVARWVTSTRIVTRMFPETAGSSTEHSWLSRTLARTPLLLMSPPSQTTLPLVVDAPRDPPPLLQIAGVTDPMTLAGRVSSSLTLWMNLTSLHLSSASPRPLRLPVSQMSFFLTLALALMGLSATQTLFETFAQPNDP